MAPVLLLLFLVGLAGVGYQLVGAARDATRVPPLGRLVDTGHGQRLHLHDVGTGGPTVVFDAGIAASSLSWSRVQPRVAVFTRTCSYDRIGLAWSDAGRGRVDAVELARQLEALLGAADVAPPYVLVGHSFGTFVVRAFAQQHRDSVVGLVLVDPIFPSEWLHMTPGARRRLSGGVVLSRVGALFARVGAVRLCLTLLAAGSTRVPRRASQLFGSDAARVLRRLVGEVQKLPREAWPAVQAHWSQPKCFVSMARHLAGLTRSAAQVAEFDPLGDLPLVVITAASQPEAGRVEHARLAGLSSRGHQVTAASSGHWIHLDEPDLIVQSIRNVIDQSNAGSAA